MSTRSPEIITRASEVDSDLVPEPWDPRDSKDDRSLVAERERYRLQGVTGENGAGIVPAYNLNVADTGSIPSKTKDGWTRGSAGRVLGPNGKYVSKGSDVPRLSFDGEDPGLLVEAAGRTNHCEYSSQIDGNNGWGGANNSLVGSQNSILEGESAYEWTSIGPGARVQQVASVFSSSTETAWAIFEQVSAGQIRLRIENKDNGDAVAGIDYDFSNENISSEFGSSNSISSNFRILQQNGPNGGQVVLLIIRYDPSDTSGGDYSGDRREIRLNIDEDGNGDNTIFHHAQIEEAANASSPIVTQGSPTTRSGDDYSIFEGGQPPWWDESGMTFIIDMTVRSYNLRPAPVPLTLNPEDDRIFVTTSGPSFDVKFRDEDGQDAFVSDVVTPFQPFRVALSITQTEARLSANGSSDVINYDGDGLGASELDLTRSTALYSFAEILPINRALPESTLNNITS